MKRSQFQSTIIINRFQTNLLEHLENLDSYFWLKKIVKNNLRDWSIKISGIQKNKKLSNTHSHSSKSGSILRTATPSLCFIRRSQYRHLLHIFSLSSWLQNERHLFKSNCSNHICSVEVYFNQIARIVFVQLMFDQIILLESYLFNWSLFKSNCSNHICSIEVYLNQIARIIFVQLTFDQIILLESCLFK